MEEAAEEIRPEPLDEAVLFAEAALGGPRDAAELLSATEVTRRRQTLAHLFQHHLLEGSSITDALDALAAHEELPGIKVGSAPHLVASGEGEHLPWREELAMGAVWARARTHSLRDRCGEALREPGLDSYGREKLICGVLDRATSAAQWDQVIALETSHVGGASAPVRLPLDAWLSFAQREFGDYWAASCFAPDLSARFLAQLTRRPSSVSLGWLSPLITELLERGDHAVARALADAMELSLIHI